jgi:hypothetical protein
MIAVERQSELALHPQTAAASPMPASVGLEENVPPRLFEPLAVDEQPSNTYELADMLVSGIDIS